MGWNDERVDLLKKLWSDGLSASQIAGRLGGVTRNAVIGKVHRLGLSGRATTSRMKSHRPRGRGQVAKRLMKPRFANLGNPALRQLYLGDTEPYVPSVEELVIPPSERRSIQTLTEVSCRWPIGDPQQPDFHFCGRAKVVGLPYCEFHARRAFQPPQPRRRERDALVPVLAQSLAQNLAQNLAQSLGATIGQGIAEEAPGAVTESVTKSLTQGTAPPAIGDALPATVATERADA